MWVCMGEGVGGAWERVWDMGVYVGCERVWERVWDVGVCTWGVRGCGRGCGMWVWEGCGRGCDGA